MAPWVSLSWWRVFRRCVSVAAALSLWIWIARVERRSAASYGLTRLPEGKRDLVAGLILGFAGLGLLLVVGLASGACRIDVTEDRLRLWRTVSTFVPAALLVGILEELVFRGFLLQHLLAWSRRGALLLSSVAYAAVHLKHTEFTGQTWMELGGLVLLGVVLGRSVLVTRGLWLAIGLHAALAYGARINKLVLVFSDEAPMWLTGTSRLVNGLGAWVLLAILWGAVEWHGRRRRVAG